jgi:hypothetical protein
MLSRVAAFQAVNHDPLSRPRVIAQFQHPDLRGAEAGVVHDAENGEIACRLYDGEESLHLLFLRKGRDGSLGSLPRTVPQFSNRLASRGERCRHVSGAVQLRPASK